MPSDALACTSRTALHSAFSRVRPTLTGTAAKASLMTSPKDTYASVLVGGALVCVLVGGALVCFLTRAANSVLVSSDT